MAAYIVGEGDDTLVLMRGNENKEVLLTIESI